MNFSRKSHLPWLAMVMLFASPGHSQESHASEAPAKPVHIPGIQNAFQLTARIYSGSQPEGELAFAALARLGVKIIVSVDGTVPDVSAARAKGLRYIHLPFGYDGIPTNRIAELAKVAKEFSGPIFVHCHHGLHRGPAAAAVICEASAGWTSERATAWLREAGTASEYAGLYRSIKEFKLPSPAVIGAVKMLPEVTKPPPLVDAMLRIDERLARLKRLLGTEPLPRSLEDQRLLVIEATLLWEDFRELQRSEASSTKPEDFRSKLEVALRAADALRNVLRTKDGAEAVDTAIKQTAESCSACHRQYRN